MPDSQELRFLTLCLQAHYDPRTLLEVSQACESGRGLDWGPVVELAQLEGVAPIVFAVLRGRGLLSRHAESVLETVYYRSAARAALLLDGLASLVPQLQAHGVTVMVLKGAALARNVYGDIGLRPMDDVDLLVRRADARAAQRVLSGLGYNMEPAEEWPGAAIRYRSDVTYRGQGGDQHPAHVGLHWHLLDVPYFYERIPVEAWLGRGSSAPFGPATALVPHACDHLVYLCGHLALHHQYEGMLRYFDVAALIRADADGPDWDGVLQRARDWRLVLPLQRTVARIQQWWPGSVPAEVAAAIAAQPATRSERRVHRWAAERRRTPPVELALAVATMPGASRRVRYLLEKVVPSPGYMRARYFAGRPRLWPLAYLARPARGLSHVLRRRT